MEIEQWISNIERELFAIVYTLKRLNHYTYGYAVRVKTDHKLLMSIWKKSVAAPSPKLQ